MPVLAYCVVECEFAGAGRLRGVRECPVRGVCVGGVQCLFSELTLDSPAAPDGLAFHKLIHTIFSERVVIPFRFPSLFDSENALRAFMADRAGQFAAALRQFSTLVQFEVRIRNVAPDLTPRSGADYLRSRAQHHAELKAIAESVRQRTADLIQDWRTVDESAGMRCYGLVGRGSWQEFQSRAQAIPLPNNVTVRITGPWPPSQFIEIDK